VCSFVHLARNFALIRLCIQCTSGTHSLTPIYPRTNQQIIQVTCIKIKQRMDYKILSLAYEVLTTTQPSYLYNLISLQPHRSIRSSDVVSLSRPPSSSSLKVNYRSFCPASLCLWNQLPKELRLPADHEDLSLSSDLTHVSSSFPSLPLSPSITPSLFHSKLIFSTNPFLHSSYTFPRTGLTPRTPAVFRFLGQVDFHFGAVC